MARNLEGVAHTRRVVIDAAPSGGNGRQRRQPVGSDLGRLRRLQKPTDIVQRRAHDEKATLAWPAFRNTPEGLLERAARGDHGARAFVLECIRRVLSTPEEAAS